MKQIQMVDLYGQYFKIKEEIDSAIQGVLDSSAFINGPDVKLFQEELAEYMDCKHVITCGNGTDALQVSLMALDLKPGDEIITTPYSFIASIEVIRLLDLVPVLVDIRPDTFNIDDNLIERAITKKTRAILPVHLFGQCARSETIMEIADKYGLYVIEDAAQALGADYIFKNGKSKKAGTIGTIGCTSFFPSKNLGCFGDGGAIFTDDEGLAKSLYSIINHGMSEKYYYEHIGVNSRLDSLQAAVLRVKLKYLDDYIQARTVAASFYNTEFDTYAQVRTPVTVDYSSHIYHQYTIELFGPDRDGLQSYLKANEIPSMIYYPKPLHLQKAYLDLNYKEGELPVAEELSQNVLSLPIHTELDEEQLRYITQHIIQYIVKE